MVEKTGCCPHCGISREENSRYWYLTFPQWSFFQVIFRCVLFCTWLRFVAGVYKLRRGDSKGQAAQQLPAGGKGHCRKGDEKGLLSKLSSLELNLPAGILTGTSNCCQQNNRSWKRMFLCCPVLLMPTVRCEYDFAVIVTLLENNSVLRGAGEQPRKALTASCRRGKRRWLQEGKWGAKPGRYVFHISRFNIYIVCI